MNYNGKGQQITLGDLVVAVTDVALEFSPNEKRAYQIAGAIVNNLLRSAAGKAGAWQHNKRYLH